MLARVAVCDYRGQTVYDTFVQPTRDVTDYRTNTTGIGAANLDKGNGARAFKEVQEAVRDLLLNKIIVGHSLWNDLLVLGIPHPAIATRDVALYQPFRNDLPNQSIGLQTLMWQLMRRRVQERTVDALENARATIDLYRSRATEWESAVSKGKWECQLPPSKFSRYYS